MSPNRTGMRSNHPGRQKQVLASVKRFEEGVSPAELADICRTKVANIDAALRRLLKRGLIQRVRVGTYVAKGGGQ